MYDNPVVYYNPLIESYFIITDYNRCNCSPWIDHQRSRYHLFHSSSLTCLLHRSHWSAKLSLSFSSIGNVQSTIFLSSAKRNQLDVTARISGDFHSAIFFRFPAFLQPQLALFACRPRVSQVNFTIKQSDARTAIVMTEKGKRGKGRRSNRFARRLRLI